MSAHISGHAPALNWPAKSSSHSWAVSSWPAPSQWTGPLLLVIAGILMLWWSWAKWPDVLVDSGRELYVPWQITQGKVLYRDIAHFQGPLSCYVNAMWFKLFGVSLHTLALCNVALIAGASVLLYRLLTEISDRFAATVAVLVFLTVFAFGQLVGFGGFNFVLPYAHELTHGIVLTIAALYCLRLYQRRPNWVSMAGLGLCLGLVFLTKLETFLAATAAVVIGVGFTLWTERPPLPRLLRLLAVLGGAALLPPLLAFLLLAQAMPADQALRSVGTILLAVLRPEFSSLPFYRQMTGTLDLEANLQKMLLWTGFYAFLWLPLLGLGLLLRLRGVGRFVLAAGLFLALAGGLYWWTQPIRQDEEHRGLLALLPMGRDVWTNAARPFPLFVLLMGIITLVMWVRRRRYPQAGSRFALQLAFIAFAGALLAKIILNVKVANYGFALTMPAALLIVVALLSWIPGFLTRCGGDGRLFQAAALAVLPLAMWGYLSDTGYWFAGRPVPVTSRMGGSSDLIWADACRGPLVREALDEIERRIDPRETLAVLPEGVTINYLSRRTNPTPYVNFMPFEMVLYGEERVLAAFQAHPPDYVALVQKDTSEYGFPFFGRDYGHRLAVWVYQNYQEVRLFGATPFRDGSFGILLMKRIDVPWTDTQVARSTPSAP